MFLDQLNARLAIKKQVSVSALDMVANAVATQTTLEYEIFKGLGKGSGRGRPKGSKNKNGGGATPAAAGPTMAAPKTNSSSDAEGGHTAEGIKEAFDVSGKHGGGTSFTPNVMMHKDNAQAQIHSGAMHGHLQDSGFKAKKVHNENGIMSTEYEHPNGSKVLLNEGSSGSNNFVGYHHSTAQSRNSDFSPKPKEAYVESTSVAPKAVEAKPNKELPDAAKPRNPSAINDNGTVDSAKFKKGLNKVAGLTDINDHNKALVHGAKLIGRTDLAEKALEISKQHLKQGNMSTDLMKQRSALHAELHAHAKKVLSPEQAHSLYMSY